MPALLMPLKRIRKLLENARRYNPSMTPIELMLGMLSFAGFSKFYGRDPKVGKYFFFAAAICASFSELLSASRSDLTTYDNVSGDFIFDITAMLLAWFGAWKVITSK